MALLAVVFLHCLIIVFPQTYEVDIPRPCNRWEILTFASVSGVWIPIRVVVLLTHNFISLQIGGWDVLCWEVKVSRESSLTEVCNISAVGRLCSEERALLSRQVAGTLPVRGTVHTGPGHGGES